MLTLTTFTGQWLSTNHMDPQVLVFFKFYEDFLLAMRFRIYVYFPFNFRCYKHCFNTSKLSYNPLVCCATASATSVQLHRTVNVCVN
jgi:hypothetical protein